MAQQQQQKEKQFELKTAPFDARFPNVNQTRNCWQNYLDYHSCLKAKGEEYEPCQYFKRVYRTLCPVEWVSEEMSVYIPFNAHLTCSRFCSFSLI